MERKKQLSHMIAMTLVTLLLMVACSTPQPSPTATPAPTPAEEISEWDYVALGDSVTFGMIPRYAEMLEQDLGVKIKLHNWTLPDDHSSRLLERLRADERLRQDLREAEVITFEIPWNVIEKPWKTFDLSPPEPVVAWTTRIASERPLMPTWRTRTKSLPRLFRFAAHPRR